MPCPTSSIGVRDHGCMCCYTTIISCIEHTNSTSETLELIEIQREMPATGIKSEFESLKILLETKIDAQNSKYNLIIGLISAGLTIALGVGGWLVATVLDKL